MTKTITMALVATLGLGLAFGACAAEKTLAEVHGGQLPAETGWATKGQCLQCHQSYDALAEKTKNLEPNPHKSHLGAVNCVECHKADKPSKQPEPDGAEHQPGFPGRDPPYEPFVLYDRAGEGRGRYPY